MKYLCNERKVDSVKRIRKEIRVEVNRKWQMKKLKMKKTFVKKENSSKTNLKETANSRAYEYHFPLAAAN